MFEISENCLHWNGSAGREALLELVVDQVLDDRRARDLAEEVRGAGHQRRGS